LLGIFRNMDSANPIRATSEINSKLAACGQQTAYMTSRQVLTADGTLMTEASMTDSIPIVGYRSGLTILPTVQNLMK
jgi:hypothetical protein